MRVREIMTTKVFTVRNDKQLVAAETIMGRAPVRHVPVVNASGGLVGVISHRDVLAAAISPLWPSRSATPSGASIWRC